MEGGGGRGREVGVWSERDARIDSGRRRTSVRQYIYNHLQKGLWLCPAFRAGLGSVSASAAGDRRVAGP